MRQVSYRNIRRALGSHSGWQYSMLIQPVPSADCDATSVWSSQVGISHPKVPWTLLEVAYFCKKFLWHSSVFPSLPHISTWTDGSSQQLYLLRASWLKYLHRDFAITVATCFKWALKTNSRRARPFPVTREDHISSHLPSLRASKHET